MYRKITFQAQAAVTFNMLGWGQVMAACQDGCSDISRPEGGSKYQVDADRH